MAAKNNAAPYCSNGAGRRALSAPSAATSDNVRLLGASCTTMSPLPSRDLANQRDGLRVHPVAADDLVAGDVLPDPTEGGLSALALKPQLGVGYNEGWRMKHKLLQVMKEHHDSQPLVEKTSWMTSTGAVSAGVESVAAAHPARRPA